MFQILERSVTSLRKYVFLVILALLAAVCTSALADQTCPLSPCPAQVTIKDKKRTILYAEDLEKHPEILSLLNMTKDEAVADWQARGVVLQAWSNPLTSRYSYIEITVNQDDEAKQFTDLVHLKDKNTWASYEKAVKESEALASDGYTFLKFQTDIKSQQSPNNNSFLMLRYKRSVPQGEYYGYMARTVYLGYTICLDLKFPTQKPPDSVATELTNIMKSFKTDESVAAEAAAAAEQQAASSPEGQASSPEGGSDVQEESSDIIITKKPPTQTITNSFKVEGTTFPGKQVIACLMRIGYDEPIRFTTTSHEKKGTFSLTITIPEPEETDWVLTLNVYDGENEDAHLIAETVFPYITYKKTLIPVTYDSVVPSSFAGEELVITGETIKNVDVQCLVTMTDGPYNWTKQIRTNGTGRFTFKIPFSDEGEYNVILVFSKKGQDTHRDTFVISHILTEEARRVQIRKSAKTVGYSVLSSNGAGAYIGQTLRFNNVYIKEVQQSGEQWLIIAAGQKTGDHYSQLLYFFYDTDPGFEVDERHTFYGKCTGMYSYESEESVESYPQFDLLLWD